MEQKTEASQACPKNFGHPHDYSLREDGKCAYCQHDEEASQAVDDLLPCPFCGAAARIESNRDWHKLRADHDESCVFDPDDYDLMYPASPGYLLEIAQVWNRRAALKAQPAPTEAAEQVHAPAERIAECKAFLATLPAQDEDSARLDFIAAHGCDGGDYGNTDWYVAGETYLNMPLREAIDHARASAETGGVKP